MLAARQHGVVSRRQLLDAGFTRKMVHTRIAAGHLLPLHRGVYAVGHRHLRREGFWLAATLAVPGSVLSHRDAAGLHGFRPANHRDVDVTATQRRERQSGIRIHRTRTLEADDIITISGIRITTVARTLVDLAGAVPADHLRKAIREADRQRLLDMNALRQVVESRRGPGRRALEEALNEHARLATTHTASTLEEAFLTAMHDHGLPIPHTNVLIEGKQVDALWREQRLVVELDGWAYHHTRDAFQRDRTRDAELARAGYRVLRFTHADVTTRPAWVAATVGDLLQPS